MNKEFLQKNRYIIFVLIAVILGIIFFRINNAKNRTALKSAPAELSISGINETALKAMEAIPQDNVPQTIERQGLQELLSKRKVDVALSYTPPHNERTR